MKLKPLELIPRRSVGEIRFGMSEDDLIKMGYCHVEYDDATNWHVYIKNDDDSFMCYVEDGLVTCVHCLSNLVYQGKQLIGINKNELIEIFGNPDEIGDPIWVSDDEQQITFEYDKNSLQVWLDENNIVVSIFCSNSEDD